MKDNELIELQFYPTVEEVKELDNYVKLPVSEASGLGMLISSLPTRVSMTLQSSEGLYKAILPKGAHLAELADGSGQLIGSAIKDGQGLVGQAKFVSVDKMATAFNPAMACASVMLMNIDHKLGEIQESQEKIISSIDTKEHGEIKGNIKMLHDVMKEAKLRWDDEKFKDDYRRKAIDIRQSAEQYLQTYKERIEKKINKNKGLHIGTEMNKIVKSLVDDFVYYRLSIFMYCYASFVETFLGNSFNKEYLDGRINDFEHKCNEYRNLYTDSYNMLEKYAHESISTKALGVASNVTKSLGKAIEKVPVISKGKVDEALISAGENINDFKDNSIQNSLNRLIAYKDIHVRQFIDQYQKIDYLYNNDFTYMIDKDNNIYLAKEAIA